MAKGNTTPAARRDSEEYAVLQAAIREIRETVGDQAHDLIIERQALASHDELVESLRHVGTVGRQLSQARGRQKQAEEMGLAVTAHIAAEREALALLRSSLMSLLTVAGSWVVRLDWDEQRPAVERSLRRGNSRHEDDLLEEVQ